MKVSIIKSVFFFGLIISLIFSLNVPYMDTPSVDGVVDLTGGEWNSQARLDLKNSTGTDVATVYFLHDGTYIYVAWIIVDSSKSVDLDSFTLNLNGYSETVHRGDARTKEYAGAYWTGELRLVYSSVGIVETEPTSVSGLFSSEDFHSSAADSSGSTTLTSESYWHECPGYAECCIDSDCSEGHFCATQGICAQIGECIGD